MKSRAFGLAALLAIAGCSGPQISVEVEGNVLRSRGFPAAVLTVDESLRYLGKDQFVLYGVADAEIHLFAEASDGRVKRLLWIQFEGYLSTSLFSYHDYSDSPERTEVGGHPYFDDVWLWRLNNRRWRKGSDTEHVFDMLKRNNLSLGPDAMAIRLVRLDESTRNELLIIYAEDLRDYQLTTAELSEDGVRSKEWPGLAKQLRQRALASFTIIDRRAP